MRAFSQQVVRRRTPWRGLIIFVAASLAAIATGVVAATIATREEPERPAVAQAARRPVRLDESTVSRIDLASSSNEQDLVLLVRDERQRASLRYAALRRLETEKPKECVRLAEEIALRRPATRDGEFLRTNAIAVLCRIKTPEGRSALDRARKSSPDAETLVGLLEKGGN
jgi:hypothetical protein